MKISFTRRLIAINFVIYFSSMALIAYFFGLFSNNEQLTYKFFALVAASFVPSLVSMFLLRRLIMNATIEFRESSDSIALSSSKLVDATQQVSSASTEQGAAIQQTVSTIIQLNATIKRSVDNAQRSYEVATNSQQAATEGQRAINEINLSNNAIMHEIDESNKNIGGILKVIMDISAKTKIINDIVFQTKLLSFNASVEAARAGEHGKGFSVVAEEIGNLAQMSGKASHDIAEMLSNSIHKVNGIVTQTRGKVESLVESGKSKVAMGTAVAKRCGDVLDQVVKNATEVNSMISEISVSAKEQAQGMNEIASAMTQLDAVTQQNTSTAANTADYAERISTKTEELRRTFRNLSAEVLGADGSRQTAFKSVTKTAVKPVARTPEIKKDRSVIPIRRKLADLPKESRIRQSTAGKAVGVDIPSGENPEFEDV